MGAGEPCLAEQAQVVVELEVADRLGVDLLQRRQQVRHLRQALAVAVGREHRIVVERADVVRHEIAAAGEAVAERDHLAGAVGHAVGLGRQADAVGEERVVDERDAAVVDRLHRLAGHIHVLVRAGRQRLEKARVGRVHRARRPVQAVGLGELARQRDVAAPVGEVGAEQRADALGVGVVLTRAAELHVDVGALVVVLEDDVDRAGDRVRAVDRRTAHRDRLDALDQLGRDVVQVHLAARGYRATERRRVGGDEAPAVDERQRALRAQAVQVHEALCDAVGRLHVAGAGRRHAEARQFRQGLADVGVAPLVEHLVGHDRGRFQPVEVRARDARTGDDDFLQAVVRGRVLGDRLGVLRAGRGAEHQADRHVQQAVEVSGTSTISE